MATSRVISSMEPSVQTAFSSYDSTMRPRVNDIALKAVGTMESRSFDAAVDLEYVEKPRVHTMEDLGLPDGTGISPVAVSEPFKLFSKQAVHQFRNEVLDPRVRKDYGFTSNIAPCQLRGYAAQYVCHQNVPSALEKIAKIWLGMLHSSTKLGEIPKRWGSYQKSLESS